MSLRFGILGLLRYGKMTGYEINKYFKESIGYFWNAQQSQIYRELAALEKEAMVESELIYQTVKPNKKLYGINEYGREQFQKWLDDEKGIDGFFKNRNVVLLKLFFSASLPHENVIKMLERFKKKCELEVKEVAEHTSDLSSYEALVENKDESLFWKMTAMYGLMSHKCFIQWAQNCIDILKKKEEEGYNDQ